MVRTEPIIAVNHVETSSRWYRSLLACRNTHAEGHVFDQLVDTDGTVLLCLHKWSDHEHPSLMSPEQGKAGHGLLLFFRVDEFDEAWERAQSAAVRIEEEPHYNPFAGHREFTLRDPDGYYVTVCSAADSAD